MIRIPKSIAHKCLRRLGLGKQFRYEKILRNRLGTVSVIPRKKVLISRSTEESISKLRTQLRELSNYAIKTVLQNSQNKLTKWCVRTSKVVFSDTIFDAQNAVPECMRKNALCHLLAFVNLLGCLDMFVDAVRHASHPAQDEQWNH